MQLRGALSDVPLGRGIIGATGELPGPARQVTLPRAWHFPCGGSILSPRRLEFVYVCYSAWKTISWCRHQKQQHPEAPLQLPSLCLLPSTSFGNLRA